MIGVKKSYTRTDPITNMSGNYSDILDVFRLSNVCRCTFSSNRTVFVVEQTGKAGCALKNNLTPRCVLLDFLLQLGKLTKTKIKFYPLKIMCFFKYTFFISI